MSELLSDVMIHFLFSLSLGTALYSWIADPKLTGAGFIRLTVGHGFIFFALGILLGWLINGSPNGLWLVLETVLLVILAAQWKMHPDKKTPSMWFLFALQVSLSLIVFNSYSGVGESVSPERYSFILSSALFLGVTHYAMLLGHYYLVVPKLTEKPLLVSLNVFWILLVLKVIVSGYSTVNASSFLAEGTMEGDGYTFNWLIISMRWLWGYGALAVLSWFAWRLCRMRSIQSATGVLYIMVFFVFVGELLSTYLFFKHGLMI